MRNRKSLFLAIPSAIIAGIIVGMITYFALNFGGYKEYKAQAKVITTNVENVDDAKDTAKTYAATINSSKIKQKTLETLAIDWNVGKFDSKLEIKPTENSSIIDIVVVDTNKLRAEDLADQYAEYSVRVLNNIYNSGASVMEYSYGSAGILDNSMRYAIIAGSIALVLWGLIQIIRISSYNRKVEKENLSASKANQVKELREVSDKSNKKDSQLNLDNKKNQQEDQSQSTQVIDSKEIKEMSQEKSSKYEILGRIPSYKKGEIDV